MTISFPLQYVSWSELIGYIASALVAVSLTMSSLMKLRWLNLAGALIFLLYGTVIGALPIVIVNTIISVADIFYLVKIYSSHEYFRMLLVNHDSLYTNYFLDFYKKDILKLFPRFSYKTNKNTIVIYLLRNVLIAGLVFAERRKGNICFLYLDYVIPRYRDMKLGKFLFFDKLDFFYEAGFDHLQIHSHTKEQERYLLKMEFYFLQNTRNGKLYQKDID